MLRKVLQKIVEMEQEDIIIQVQMQFNLMKERGQLVGVRPNSPLKAMKMKFQRKMKRELVQLLLKEGLLSLQ